jgi:hypothetical protein
MGDPITVSAAEIILETTAGIQIKDTIIPNLQPGVNYRLSVPMDAGLTADNYKPTALRPTVPFRLKVKIGQTTYLPIEMTGDFRNLGKPAESTRLDLTLGEDSDGDGLPDAWERALIAASGGTLTLQDIRPGDDFDGDGLSNLDEYLAGTYAFDPTDGFSLAIISANERAFALEFLVLRGRTYTLWASSDLSRWTPVAFRVPDEGPQAPLRNSYPATDVRRLQVEVPADARSETNRYFKAMVQ